jgi:hypothetical protein
VRPRWIWCGHAALAAVVAWTGEVAAQEQSPATGAPSLPSRDPEADAAATGNAGAGDAHPLAAPAEAEQQTLVEQELQELRERLQRAEDARSKTVSRLTVSGYVDLGFFAPFGNNGVGWVRDVGNRQRPDLERFGWTFLGDILGSPINSRGEAADLGDGTAIERFDSVNSDGAPGFIVNEVNLSIGYTLAESALLRTSLNFMPRSATLDYALGDFLEVDLAELEYLLTEDGKTSFFVGKVLPVFGVEYRDRKSNQRFGITPSLIARYTTGPQLGAKVRSRLFDDWLILAAAVTNNPSVVEQFDFYREIDRNTGKTLSGRVATSIPFYGLAALEGDRVEIGASGQWGAQDDDTRSDRQLWLIGADLQYQSTNLTLTAELMTGESPGSPDADVWALDLSPSGYVELDWQVHARLGFLLRGDLRDALVRLGTERVYVTHQARFTGGLRWLFYPNLIAKVEYFHNQELGGMAQFNNDMFTSSLLLTY